jgi:hypothetical protein
VTAITICLNWMAVVITFTVSSRVMSQCGRARDWIGEEDETVSKTTGLISTFERWLISLFFRATR